MKVLFATDGSKDDAPARSFVTSARWATGTGIELFGVMRPAGLAVTGEMVDRKARDFERELGYLSSSLPTRDCRVTWRCAVGEPAEEITARARTIAADLIVVGSRGRGALAASILGSVSAGVIDHAPCPVLVARRGGVARVVLADDGSAGAATAAALLDEWPIFGGSSLAVVSVVHMGRPLASNEGPALYAEGEHLYDSLREARERAHRTVTARATALDARPRPIKTSVRLGEAADQILAAAHDFNADLIVVGSRGHTGLARIFAGSVARQVLLGAKCSVLIARGSAAIVHDREPAPLGVLALASPWSVRTP